MYSKVNVEGIPMGSLFFLLAGVVAGESWGVLEGVSSRLLLFVVRD